MIGRGVTKNPFVLSLKSRERRPPKILINYDYDTSFLRRPTENFPAVCKQCGKTVRASMNVTTNLVNHIKKHLGIQKDNKIKDIQMSDSLQLTTSSTSSDTLSIDENSDETLESLIVTTFIKCSLPLDALKMDLFCEMLTKLNSNVSLNEDKLMSEIDKLYARTKLNVSRLIQSNDMVSLVFDYIEQDNLYYSTLYACSLDHEWNAHRFLLSCEKLIDSKQIEQFILNTIDLFELRPKVYTICLNKHIQLNTSYTRINSCLSLLEQIILDNKSLNITNAASLNDLIGALEASHTFTDLILLLEPFSDLYNDLIKEANSISFMYPAYKGLLTHLNYFKENVNLKEVVTELEMILRKEFSFIEEMPVFALGSILNPNFGFSWCEQSDVYEQLLKDEFLKERCVQIELGQHVQQQPQPVQSMPRKSYLCFAKKIVVKNEDETLNEVNSYISFVKTFVYDEHFDVFGYWRQNEKVMPNLAKFARKIFTASVCLSEEPDRDVADIVSKMSNQMMNDESFSQVVFIKSNSIVLN